MFFCIEQIPANRGPDSRFVIEANTKALISLAIFELLGEFLFVLFEYITRSRSGSRVQILARDGGQ